jgi:hypothetical protein
MGVWFGGGREREALVRSSRVYRPSIPGPCLDLPVFLLPLPSPVPATAMMSHSKSIKDTTVPLLHCRSSAPLPLVSRRQLDFSRLSPDRPPQYTPQGDPPHHAMTMPHLATALPSPLPPAAPSAPLIRRQRHICQRAAPACLDKQQPWRPGVLSDGMAALMLQISRSVRPSLPPQGFRGCSSSVWSLASGLLRATLGRPACLDYLHPQTDEGISR